MTTMHVVFIGPDRGLGSALESQGATVARIDGQANAETLGAAGVDTADLLVLTDAGEATAVPVAREANPTLRIVVFTPDSLPEFVRGQVDLAVSPAALDASVVAEELAGDA
jgi:hypothetical protein